MPNQPIVTAGLVLRETVTRETDKILTVLTPDRGKISLIARGARRKNSRLAAACQLFAWSEMTLYRRGNWYYLDAAEPDVGVPPALVRFRPGGPLDSGFGVGAFLQHL